MKCQKLFVFILVPTALLFGAAIGWASKSHFKTIPLSNLSKGTFERQIEVPESVNLEPNSELMKKALEDYKKLPFDIGERIKYAITFKYVNIGSAEALVRTPIKWGSNSWAHRFTGEVVGASWYSWLVQIHDSVEGIAGPTLELPPLRFYINQQEGGFRQSKVVEFDNDAKKVRQVTKRKEWKENKKSEYNTEADVKDALAALYYFRALNKPGEGKKEFKFPVFTSEKTWTASAKLEGGPQKITVEGNTYDTDVYTLKTQLGGILQQNDPGSINNNKDPKAAAPPDKRGKITAWMTRDARRLPVYVEADVKFGYIRVSLTEWDQGFADRAAKTLFDKIRAK